MSKDQEYKEAMARSWVAADIFSEVRLMRPMRKTAPSRKYVDVDTYNARLLEMKNKLAQEAVDAENVVKELALANVK